MEPKTDVFGNLKHAFEEAVEYVLKNGMPKENEMRRSELLEAVRSEASRRLKQPEYLYRADVVANLDSGRMKFQR